jgi:hypothetical protein
MCLKSLAALVDHMKDLAVQENQQVMAFLANRSQDWLADITTTMNERNIRFFGGTMSPSGTDGRKTFSVNNGQTCHSFRKKTR